MRWMCVTIIGTNLGSLSVGHNSTHSVVYSDDSKWSFNANQIIYYRASRNSYDTKTNKAINFQLSLKDMYLSNYNNVNISLACKNLQQTTSVNNDGDVGIYLPYAFNNFKSDINNNRVFNWNNRLDPYLYMNTTQTDLSFGYCPTQLYLKNELILDKAVPLYNGDATVTFVDDNNRVIDFNDLTVINKYFNDMNVNNDNGQLYGIPYSRFRVMVMADIFPPFRATALAFIGNFNGSSAPFIPMTLSQDTTPITKKINFDNLLAIKNANYDDKYITLGFDDDFLQETLTMHDDTQNICNQIKPIIESSAKYKDFNKFDMLVKMNLLDENGIVPFISYLNSLSNFDFMKCVNWLKSATTILQTEAQSYGWNKYDNPYEVWNEIKNKENYSIEYAITDENNKNQWQTKIVNNLSYNELTNGVKILLNENNNHEYKLKFIRFSNQVIANSDTFIQYTSTNKITNSTKNVNNEPENIFKLSDMKIDGVTYKPNNLSWNSQYTPSSLSDEMLINTYAILITNYNTIGNFKMLDKDDYNIARNDLAGEIMISIKVNGINVTTMLNGFKNTPTKINNVVNKDANLSIADIDDTTLREILVSNNYDRYLVDILSFTFIDFDYIKGTCLIEITNCKRPDLAHFFNNQKFTVSNLLPFYINQRAKIASDVKKMKPSQINNDIFFNSLVDMSDGFVNQNLDNVKVKLNANDKKEILNTTITYFQKNINKWTTKEFSYNFNVKTTVAWYIWLIIGLLFLAFIIISVFTWIPKTIKKVSIAIKKRKQI